ncbi:phosphatase PAP2 family protein [Clostridium tyrobutyricum]|uniref:phosphatase PAP2 family protein n=1 Tax=Clostridium tyrobutyricum TaxID=1519 RepID=UPI001C3883DD|nr:phosphatase PAP2 family protein [Clostridium tyrobutyricum]MBV4428140.1 phosphatase PAP2 family protein [Clostridium tyrobutyricum]MBV4442517.1 phosphatase PAP2 family protein [Clostridium tyrobutyricum]
MYNIREGTLLSNLQYIFSKVLNLIYEYYFVIIGAFLLKKAIRLCMYPSISPTTKVYMFLLAFISFSAYGDMRKNIKLISFLLFCIPFLVFVFFLNKYGYQVWGKMLSWEISKKIVVNLNPVFSKIPFNDGAFARIYKTETLTWYFRMVYNNGFVLPVLIAIYRSAIIKDFKKMVQYGLSSHIVQVFLITPFYLLFHLQEVWFVLNQPDGLARHLSKMAAAGVTLNCFPSMHTSINFAVLLLVLREKNKPFKIVMSFFCISVIFSTLYLEVHWVLDVLAGILLAFVTVKLVDFILANSQKLIQKPLNKFYYKSIKTSYINNYYLEVTKKH